MQPSETVLRSFLISLGARSFLLASIACALVGTYLVGCGSTPTRDSDSQRTETADRAQDNWEDAGENVASEGETSRGADELSDLAADGSGRTSNPQTPDQVMDDLRRLAELKLLESEHQVTLGDAAYDAADFATAADHYKRALALNPQQLDVRERYNNALVILGKRSGEVRSISGELTDKKRAASEQRLFDARRAVEQTRAHMAEGDYEAAQRSIRKVYEEITIYDDYPEDVRRDVTDLV